MRTVYLSRVACRWSKSARLNHATNVAAESQRTGMAGWTWPSGWADGGSTFETRRISVVTTYGVPT